MTVKDLWIAVLRRWRGAVLLLLIVVGTTAVVTAQAPRVYESRTTIYFAAAGEDGESTGNLFEMPSGERATLSRIARSPLTLDPVREELGLDQSVPLHVEAISAGSDTALFDFVVRSDSPDRAAQVAAVVPRQLAEDARSYAPTLAQSGTQVRAQVVDAPTRSSVPVEPDPIRNLLLAGLAGVMLGLAYALAGHALDTRLRTAEDVERISDRPVLSAIPMLEGKGDGRALYVYDDPFGSHAEAVRKLRTNLTFVDVARNEGTHSSSPPHFQGRGRRPRS
ncbi:YveK family protein [Ornithinimicrobium sp. W1665]|uniref:YveK family protein n=1 Tax=Ornithinimicrobium sp. W1665 TaxID=3416666 RepID=UPI003CF530C3